MRAPCLAGLSARRYRGFPSMDFRARSSAGEHYVDIVGVTGSIPVAPTISFNDLIPFNDLKASKTLFAASSVGAGFKSSQPNRQTCSSASAPLYRSGGPISSRSSAKSKFTFRRSEFQYVRLGHGHWSVAEREADDETDNV